MHIKKTVRHSTDSLHSNIHLLTTNTVRWAQGPNLALYRRSQLWFLCHPWNEAFYLLLPRPLRNPPFQDSISVVPFRYFFHTAHGKSMANIAGEWIRNTWLIWIWVWTRCSLIDKVWGMEGMDTWELAIAMLWCFDISEWMHLMNTILLSLPCVISHSLITFINALWFLPRSPFFMSFPQVLVFQCLSFYPMLPELSFCMFHQSKTFENLKAPRAIWEFRNGLG